MDHPFKVGKQYRNRHGEYEVVRLDAPRMVIRYADGRRLETTVSLQARIWKNMQAEERNRAQARKRRKTRSTSRRAAGLAKELFQRSLDDIFIAYAFCYVDRAVAALDEAPPDVEAVIVQPYYKGRIVSARNAMLLYHLLTGGRAIPILFTPQTRHQEQTFAYGSRLLDLCHEGDIDRVRKNVDAGKWLVWDEILYACNHLIIQKPIRELPVKPPIDVATNLLRGPTQGQPTGAVSIPSPKVLDPSLRHLLEDL